FICSQANKQRNIERQARHLAADRGRLARCLCRLDNACDRAKDRRVKRLIPVRDHLIVSIDAKRILDKIVRPAGEEIDALQDLIDDKYRGRQFDHGTDLRKMDAFEPAEFVVDQGPNLLDVLNTGGHRQDDRDIPFSIRTQDSSELYPEIPFACKPEADRSHSERRILLRLTASERDLVKVEIERPDTDLASGSSLCSSLICSILTFLVGPAFDPGKKIFRTHEADACSTFFEGPGHFCRAVGVHIESKSRVGGFIRLDRTCRCCRKFLLSEC